MTPREMIAAIREMQERVHINTGHTSTITIELEPYWYELICAEYGAIQFPPYNGDPHEVIRLGYPLVVAVTPSLYLKPKVKKP